MAATIYDASRLYTRMSLKMGWTFKEIDAMHFPSFFAAIREVQLAHEEEQAAYGDASSSLPSYNA